MISKAEFLKRVARLESFGSKSGKQYVNLSMSNDILSFTRESTGVIWKLSLDDVYQIYLKEDFFNTVVIRKHLSNRTYSPILGLLMATGLCDVNGKRLMK